MFSAVSSDGVRLDFLRLLQEGGAAPPGHLQEAFELLVSQRTLGEELLADGRVAGLRADVGGVDEGGIEGGQRLSVVGEHAQQEVLLEGEGRLLLGLELAEHLEDAAVGVELPDGGQEEVLTFVSSRVDGATVAVVLVIWLPVVAVGAPVVAAVVPSSCVSYDGCALEGSQPTDGQGGRANGCGAGEDDDALGGHEPREAEDGDEEVAAAHLGWEARFH